MTTIVEDRQQQIQTLESLLEREKIIYTELPQKMNKADEELLRLRREKDMSNQNYPEALGKIREFKILYERAQERIREVEAELVAEQAVVSMVEGLLRKKNEEICTIESALKEQSADVDALKTRIAELEKVN